jgi:hypothetical protein
MGTEPGDCFEDQTNPTEALPAGEPTKVGRRRRRTSVRVPQVALMIETSTAYGRTILRGVSPRGELSLSPPHPMQSSLPAGKSPTGTLRSPATKGRRRGITAS